MSQNPLWHIQVTDSISPTIQTQKYIIYNHIKQRNAHIWETETSE